MSAELLPIVDECPRYACTTVDWRRCEKCSDWRGPKSFSSCVILCGHEKAEPSDERTREARRQVFRDIAAGVGHVVYCDPPRAAKE